VTALAREIERATGRGVRVLIIDSGVDDQHPALRQVSVSHYAARADLLGACAVHPDVCGDASGHGTAVAAIIASYAPNVALTSLRIFGEGNRATSEFLLAALDWGITQGFDVINASFGTTYLALLARFKARVDSAFVNGSVIVSASHNFDVRVVEFPAHFPTVVSVEAAELPPLAIERVPKRLVEFRAAGINLRTAWRDGGWAVMSGSSFAAPHVAALVARIKEVRPNWNAAQVKSGLYELCPP